MIPYDRFLTAYTAFRRPPNPEQAEAIRKPPRDPLFIVAGPGTGKTTCLSLRILKMILVDGVPPSAVLATTFTRKAAAELRSRVLSWGFQLIEILERDRSLNPDARAFASRIDINQVITGTIDSICQDVLSRFRDPGTQPPLLADETIARTLLLRNGLLDGRRDQDQDLSDFLLYVNGDQKWGFNLGCKTELLLGLWDRRHHDQVAWQKFLTKGSSNHSAGRLQVDAAHEAYRTALRALGMVDYTLLEQEILQRLRQQQLKEFADGLQVVLVDEYQDTNLLQESIYFELAKRCEGALVVVGDDDQSLYRFRGATVELFRNFPERYKVEFRCKPKTIFLKTNYRSTKIIVDLVRRYATLDPPYQEVRVELKPDLKNSPAAIEGAPILGLFRPTLEDLARDLAAFIHRTFRGKGHKLPDGTVVRADGKNGDLGDCALLCSSPRECKQDGKPRLPLLLRRELLALTPPIEVFNPRGEDLSAIPLIQRFGGLLLECLDPNGGVQGQIRISHEERDCLQEWRDSAMQYISDSSRKPLRDYASKWAARDPGRRGWDWPRSVPVLDLIYGLVHFFPELHDDPEGQVFLEVFTRQVRACEQIGKFKGRVVTDIAQPGLSEASVRELLRSFLLPIATGSVGVDEELIDAFPRDRLSILSIHQSKGLEFPLVIVDVGSDFKRSHPAHAFKRFPEDGGTPHRLEDLLRPHTKLGAPKRSQRDRAFDDLYRQFFVAFSRPQDVLLLVGLDVSAPAGFVANVATGWRRDGSSAWPSKPPLIRI